MPAQSSTPGTQKPQLVVYHLGLFNWENRLLEHAIIKEVAKAFYRRETEEDQDGWFRRNEDPGLKVSITHSRIIIEQSCYLGHEEEITDFGKFRERRADLDKNAIKYLKERAQDFQVSNVRREIFGKHFPRQFIFVYPLIIMNRQCPLYIQQFEKNGVSAWKNVVDNSTSCFFTVLEDTGISWRSWLLRYPLGPWWNPLLWWDGWSSWRRRRKVSLRISGSSLIMGEASGSFVHRIVNMIYYAGLYEMTRKTAELPEEIVHSGLEHLLERQGNEIANTITARTQEEKLANINDVLYYFTIFVGIVTFLSFLIALFGYHL